MLSFEELEQYLEKITYKPSWCFRLEPRPYGYDFFLMVTFHTLDTYSDPVGVKNPVEEFSGLDIQLRKEVKIGMRHRLRGPFLGYPQFERAVLDVIDKCERHETREWFRVDGVMKYNPHRAGAVS